MRVRNYVVWLVMHTCEVKLRARWAPPEHHRAPLWVVGPAELKHISVLHRGKESKQDECRSKHIFLSACREVVLASPLFFG